MPARRTTPTLLIGLIIAGSAWALYWPARNFGFVYDDGLYILQNPQVRRGLTGEGIAWAFRSFYAENWHPLTWISHMADVSLFGMAPGAHHLMSVFLHGLVALLLLLALKRMTGGLLPSAAVAALFALHPLRVESVAWVAERKDILSTLAWCALLWLYAGYARRPHPWRYAILCVVFALGVMAKPMVVTLPCVLLLLDVWPLGRKLEWRLVAEKLPLAAIAAGASYLTFAAQAAGGAVKALETFPFDARLANAATVYVRYAAKLLWPAHLAVFYPHPGDALPLWHALAATALLLLATAAVLLGARRRPWLATGWLWYLGTLVPVIGFVQVGSQSMADRYTYIPGIGLLLMAVWSAREAVRRRPALGTTFAAAFLVVALGLTVATRLQLRHWRDDEALFRRALAVTSGSYLAHNNLANALIRRNRVDEALPHYEEALRLRPGYVEATVGVGMVLQARGRLREAEALYRDVLLLRPDYGVARRNLGVVLALEGSPVAALEEFLTVLRSSPGDPELLQNVAKVLVELGRYDEATVRYEESLRAAPENPAARIGYGYLCWRLGRSDEAVAHFREAVRLDPASVEALNNLGVLLTEQGRAQEAAIHLKRALVLRPGNERIRRNLDDALRLQEGATSLPGGR